MRGYCCGVAEGSDGGGAVVVSLVEGVTGHQDGGQVRVAQTRAVKAALTTCKCNTVSLYYVRPLYINK